MLILTRKSGESLLLGDDIEIRIVEVSGDKVKIGIEAPAQVRVLRRELLPTIEENKLAAQRPDPAAIRSLLARRD